MEGYYVFARVGSRMKQYVINAYNSDIVPLENESVLMNIIRPHLELRPHDEDLEEFDDETMKNEVIRIELPHDRKKVYSVSKQKVYVCNTLWRNRLSSKGQFKVKRFFERNFKFAFYTYMDGDIERQEMMKKEGEIYNEMISGIQAFMDKYHLPYVERDLRTLARDWYRHRDKVEGYKISPIAF